jgi:hypothetical protein
MLAHRRLRVETPDLALMPLKEELYFYHRKMSAAFGSKYNHSSTQDLIAQIESRIDKIQPSNVGRMNIDKLYTMIKANPYLGPVFAHLLAYAISRESDEGWPEFTHRKDAKDFPRNSRAQREEYLRRKHIDDRDCPPLNKGVSAAFRILWTESKLFRSAEQLPDYVRLQTSQLRKEFFEALVSGFFVDKSDGSLRVILDGRWANALFDRDYGRFSMFAFATLRQVIDNMCHRGRDGRRKRFYALNLDLRHWFHQLPLALRYQLCMGVPLNNLFHLLPNAHPMGWLMSPFIGQNCTWSLVLHNANGNFGHGVDYNFLKKHQRGPPSWLPLKGGGGIFVILDNILVVSPNKEIVEGWMENIVNNCIEFGAKLKLKDDPKPEEASSLKCIRKECFYELKPRGRNETFDPNTETHFNFHGVNWYYDRHLIEVGDTDDTDYCFPSPAPIVREERTIYWQGTRRKMSRILGVLNWHRQVHGIRYSDPRHRKSSAAIRAIYSNLTPDRQEAERWEDSFIIEEKEIYDGLLEAWNLRKSQTPALASPLASEPPADDHIFYGAADAATNEQEGRKKSPRIAAIWFRNGTQTGSVEEVVEKPFEDPESHIAYGELEGALLLIRTIYAHIDPNIRGGLIILATDSQVAKHWLDTRDSRCDAALKILGQIEEELRSRNFRLYTVYIHTSLNLSDVPSRLGKDGYLKENVEKNAKRREATQAILHLAKMEALGSFFQDGGVIGGVDKAVTQNTR